MSLKTPQLLLLLLCLSACRNEPKESEIPLHFESISVIKKSGQGCLEDDFDCTVISIEVPQADGPEAISENINATLKAHIFSLAFSEEPSRALTYEDYAKEFIANQKQAAADFQETFPWKAIVSGQLLSDKENLISIAIDSEIFTGGAHGYRSISFFNFDPQTGKRLEHQDIFTKDFVTYAEKAFRQQFDIPAEVSINSTGLWFEEDRFILPLNIGFDRENAILIYNAYEVASYAQGDFRLEFPIKDLEKYLKLEMTPKETDL